MTDVGAREPWHLDRRIPVALILVILLQTVGVVWWAASTSARVDAVEKSIVFNQISNRRNWDKLNEDGDKVANTAERVAAMEATLGHVARQLDRILDRLDNGK